MAKWEAALWKKGPRHKSGCNCNNELELPFKWVRTSDRGKQNAYGTVCCKHFSVSHGATDNIRSLARTFAARSYKQWVKRNLQTENQIPGPSEWLGMRSWNLSWRNARRHKFAWLGSCVKCLQCEIMLCMIYCMLWGCPSPWASCYQSSIKLAIVQTTAFGIVVSSQQMSQLMRLWHFSSSVNSIFKRACTAIQWGLSDFWSDPSSTSILHVCKQRRLWRDCADVQSRLSLHCSHVL